MSHLGWDPLIYHPMIKHKKSKNRIYFLVKIFKKGNKRRCLAWDRITYDSGCYLLMNNGTKNTILNQYHFISVISGWFTIMMKLQLDHIFIMCTIDESLNNEYLYPSMISFICLCLLIIFPCHLCRRGWEYNTSYPSIL